MAISPNFLDVNFQEEIRGFEAYFDKKLSGMSAKKGESLNIDIPSGYSTRHHMVLKERYIDVGWTNVVLNSDQREGDWVTFTL